MAEVKTEYERLLARLVYMTHGPGRPAKHKFLDGGDEDVQRWRAERKRLIERMRQLP